MGDRTAYIEVADTSQYVFTNAAYEDMVIWTQTSNQAIHIGTMYSNLPAMTIRKNSAFFNSNVAIMGNFSIGSSNEAAVALELNTTDALLIPKGTTLQRPAVPKQGHIRYNTTNSTFEGFGSGNAWGSLGGVKDTNQDTYISAESYPTSNDDTIRFYTSNNEVARIMPNGRLGLSNTSPTERLELSGGNAKFNEKVYIMSNLGVGTSNPSEALHVEGNTYISGDLTVMGTTTTISTVNMAVSDNVITLNNGAAYTSNLISGLEVNRGAGYSNYYLVYDEASKYFRVGLSNRLQAVATRDDAPAPLSVPFYDADNRKYSACNTFTFSNQCLGIGTSSPAAPLHVQGLAYATSLGIGTSNPTTIAEINGTDALLIPKGTTAQRPGGPKQGQVRYNTDINTFEGFGAGNAWGSLGGVKDTNQDTFISAESYPTSNDDNLVFYNSNVENVRIYPSGDTTMRASLLTSNLIVHGQDTPAAPGLSWSNDRSTGIYHNADGHIGFAAKGGHVASIKGVIAPPVVPPAPVYVNETSSNIDGITYTFLGSGHYNNTSCWTFDGDLTTMTFIDGYDTNQGGIYVGSATPTVDTTTSTTYTGAWVQVTTSIPIIMTAFNISAQRTRELAVFGSSDATNFTLIYIGTFTDGQIDSATTYTTIPVNNMMQYTTYRFVTTKGWAWAPSYREIRILTSPDAMSFLGVGTSNPQSTIDAKGTIAVYKTPASLSTTGLNQHAIHLINASNPSYQMYMGADAANGCSYIQATNNSTPIPLALQFNGGHVGIGKSNPATPLDVFGNTAIDGNVTATQKVLSRGIQVQKRTASFTGSASLPSGLVQGFSNDNYGIVISTPSNNPTNYFKFVANSTEVARLSGQGQLTLTSNLLLSGHVVPASNATYDLGTSNLRFRDLYLTSNTIFLGDAKVRKTPQGVVILDSNDAPHPTISSQLVLSNIGVVSISIANSNLAFTTSNTERMRLTNSGLLGIGTPTPLEAIHTTGKVYTTTQFLSTSNDSATTPSFSFREDSNTGMFHPSNYSIGFATNGTERIRIADTGFIGMGTTSPLETLHTEGKIYSTTQFLSTSNDSAATPSFSFREDSNTGMFHPSNDTVGISAGGIEVFRASQSNVQVGPPTSFTSNISIAGGLVQAPSAQAYPPVAIPVSRFITGQSYGNGQYVVTSSTNTTAPLNAFDKSGGTYFYVNNGMFGGGIATTYSGSTTTTYNTNQTASGEWIQIKLPHPIRVTTFTTSWENSQVALSSGFFLGSTDGTTWVNLLMLSGYWSGYSLSTGTVNATTPYQFYRLVFSSKTDTGQGGWNYIAMGELTINGISINTLGMTGTLNGDNIACNDLRAKDTVSATTINAGGNTLSSSGTTLNVGSNLQINGNIFFGSGGSMMMMSGGSAVAPFWDWGDLYTNTGATVPLVSGSVGILSTKIDYAGAHGIFIVTYNYGGGFIRTILQRSGGENGNLMDVTYDTTNNKLRYFNSTGGYRSCTWSYIRIV